MPDPYDIPSKREVKKSGAMDWLGQAMAEQEQRNQELAGMLSGDSDSLSAKHKSLKEMWNTPAGPEPDEEPPPPDLFAEERQNAQRRTDRLSEVFQSEREARQRENEELLNMFGLPPGPPRSKSKKRRS